ncbi:hypothetical protein Curi_c00600 [Gottschalkia acidurici 9a]|uniref:Uncharacterized protein n=1 Tax=Gottschalkia acidurici (strain ATCC 7906 / DSM 604 / BCRC 14475 / CIP 104303 / KCTC 5404 / NCIMB 10678 / 9a) TaxID=1128398 RepID=K0AXH0_GOTA9|nr:hypothetical protein Curi_c00600 [Gottschalkia acidurici 9a]
MYTESTYSDNTIENYIDSINIEIISCEDIYKTGNVILDIILNEKNQPAMKII